MKTIGILSILLIALSCGNSQEEKLLQQSFEIHEKSVAVLSQINQDLERLNTESASDSSKQNLVLKDSLIRFQSDLSMWESNMVEVPGFEHDHSGHDHDHSDHDHDHHHHDSDPDLTPEMMLQVQEHLYEEINQLQIRLQNIETSNTSKL